MDSERPNLSTAEPTPDSPAPTQTSPVSPSDVSDGSSKPPKRSSTKKLVAAIVAAVIVIGGLIFLFLSPWSPFVSAAPKGPKLLVGSHAYIDVCSVVDKDIVAKELEIKRDINKENTNQAFAYDPANTQDKEVDLAKKLDSDSVLSTCTLKMDRIKEGAGEKQTISFINTLIALEQFTDEDKAREAFGNDKRVAIGAKAVPSFDDDNSFYSRPRSAAAGASRTIQPKILHKNMIIDLSATLADDDTNGEQAAKALSAITKDIIDRINKNQGQEPKNFNGTNKIGENNFTDVCRSVNYVKVAAAMGNNTQFNVKPVGASQAYAPDNNAGATPNHLTSACVFTFRTQYEADQAKNYRPPEGTDTELKPTDQFPHYLSMQIAATANKEDAQKFLEAARKESEKSANDQNNGEGKTTVENVELGDGAIMVTTETRDNTGTSDGGSMGQLFYITKGAYVLIVSANYVKQELPIKTEVKTLGLDQIKKIYKEMAMATKRAN